MKHPRRRVGQPWAPIYSEKPLDWKEERKGMARFLPEIWPPASPASRTSWRSGSACWPRSTS